MGTDNQPTSENSTPAVRRYRYPKKCPDCLEELTEKKAVILEVSVAGQVLTFFTQLDEDGILEDVDRLVANGYHSATVCGNCYELLAYHEETVDD